MNPFASKPAMPNLAVAVEIEFNGVCREVQVAAVMQVGRQKDCDIHVDDPAVSGRHLRVRPAEGGLYFEDAGSSNGSFLDGRVMEAGLCGPGMILRIGKTLIKVKPPEQKEAQAESYEVLQSKRVDDPLHLSNSFDRILFEVSLLLASEQELSPFYEKTLDILMKHFPFLSSAGIVLWPDRSHPELMAFRSRKGRPTVSETVIRKVAEERVAVLLRDVRASAAQSAKDVGASLLIGGVESLLAAPIVRAGEVIGLFQLEAPSMPFTEDDLKSAMAVGAILGAVIDGAQARAKAREADRGKALLERYLSRDVVDRVLNSENALALGGDLRDVTVFFSDIRGYTSLSERLDPEKLVGVLNHFFGRMVQKIFEYDGMIDKFIGDAVMAVFGAPYPSIDDARRACKMAVAVRAEVQDLAAGLLRDTGIAIDMGYGLASGKVISGNIGWERRMEYTSIGDTVNLSSRLVGLAGPGEIFIDEETIRRAGRMETRERGEMAVKGKAKPVRVYELVKVIEP